MKFFTQWLIDNFGFSSTEAKGTLILIFVILAAAFVPRIYFIQENSSSNSFSNDRESLEKWGAQLESFIAEANPPNTEPSPPPQKTYKHFEFDPNTATYSELASLGLGEYSSKNIISYRDAGGTFQTKADLNKIYGIDEERVKQLWDYIDLPEKVNKKRPENPKEAPPLKQTSDPEPTEKINFDINEATVSELQRVRGIGPAYSKRIIEYREKLGGFRSPDQLFEVWGLKEETIVTLIEHATFSNPRKLRNINTDSLKHLYTHPYIDYNLAKAIFNFRRQRGRLDSVSQLRQIKILDDSLYQKLYPYLSVE